jgi:hypothetical protein
MWSTGIFPFCQRRVSISEMLVLFSPFFAHALALQGPTMATVHWQVAGARDLVNIKSYSQEVLCTTHAHVCLWSVGHRKDPGSVGKLLGERQTLWADMGDL